MTNYEELSDSSKVWIYNSNRAFTSVEQQHINKKAIQFVEQWESHGNSVKGRIAIYQDRFIVIFADDQGDVMCGRAMDSSVRFIKELEGELGLTLMDRMLLAYCNDDEVLTVDMENFKKQSERGEITSDTIVFNNLVSTKRDFEKSWKVPVSQSWHQNIL